MVALFVSLSAKLFVWPASDPVNGARADAVVVLDGGLAGRSPSNWPRSGPLP